MPLWLALTILAAIVALFGTCACILAARADVRPFMLDRDEAERVRDFGDMPFGATPEALTITNEGE